MLCIGLDPDFTKLPKSLQSFPPHEAILQFNLEIISATADLASAFKPNLAFYEVLGSKGWDVFQKTVEAIPANCQIIADCKRGDIGNTAEKYAETFFRHFKCDAVTVSPYMGADAVLPFLAYENTTTYVLALTSNAGAMDFEYGLIDAKPLYLHVAEKCMHWNHQSRGTCGLVVGATQGEKMMEVRKAAPSLPFLIPGVGAQGGDLGEAVAAGRALGGSVLINSSRQILYASSGNDFAEAARKEASKLHQELVNLSSS